MEAIFDNKTDVLNAKLHAMHDNSVIYAVSTDQTLWTRTFTYIKDMNPALSLSSSHSGSLPPPSYHSHAAPGMSLGAGAIDANSGVGGAMIITSRPGHGGSCPTSGAGASGSGIVVGIINWAQKTFEVYGQRRAIKDIRRKGKGLRNKSRYWKWCDGREEYDIVHREGGWEATCTSTGAVEGKLCVPYRPHLFGKTKPIILELSRTALKRDEVFLILAFIYCEVKRQEKTLAIYIGQNVGMVGLVMTKLIGDEKQQEVI